MGAHGAVIDIAARRRKGDRVRTIPPVPKIPARPLGQCPKRLGKEGRETWRLLSHGAYWLCEIDRPLLTSVVAAILELRGIEEALKSPDSNEESRRLWQLHSSNYRKIHTGLEALCLTPMKRVRIAGAMPQDAAEDDSEYDI